MAAKATKKQQELLDSMTRHGNLSVGRYISADIYRSFMALVSKGLARIVEDKGAFVTFGITEGN